jgi:hypothetical protein
VLLQASGADVIWIVCMQQCSCDVRRWAPFSLLLIAVCSSADRRALLQNNRLFQIAEPARPEHWSSALPWAILGLFMAAQGCCCCGAACFCQPT